MEFVRATGLQDIALGHDHVEGQGLVNSLELEMGTLEQGQLAQH